MSEPFAGYIRRLIREYEVIQETEKSLEIRKTRLEKDVSELPEKYRAKYYAATEKIRDKAR